jgi:transposase
MSSPTVEVLGAERRRRFTAEDRARIVAETYAPGMTVSQVARLNGIGRDLLFHWRRDARDRAAGTALLPVEVRTIQGKYQGKYGDSIRIPPMISSGER